jgi:transcriptional regulator with XRE-family HTH domain
MTILRFFSLVADVLVRLRKATGETQAVVAARAGLSGNQLSKYERGQVMPDISTTLQLLHAYGQHLVVLPAPIAETLPERDAVVVAATAIVVRDGFDGRSDALHNAVQRLVAAELRYHGDGAYTRLVEGGH